MTVTVFASGQTACAARGRELGEAWADQIHAGWAAYDRMFAAREVDAAMVREIGKRTLEEVEGWDAGLAEELTGIASGAALEPWQVAALNARTEILARALPPARGECSTSVYLPAGGLPPRTIQTWDWYDHLRDVKLVWQLQGRGGRTVKTFTEFGVLGKIGVNDGGLGVHFNLLRHAEDGGTSGVPVHLVARRILEEATTIEQAGEIARSARVAASTAITVVTHAAHGSDARTFELSPKGVAEVAAGPDGFLLHTNHFVDEDLARGERLGSEDPDTYARLSELKRRKERLDSVDVGDRAAALDCHAEDGAAICCHPGAGTDPGERYRTLLVIGLDLPGGRLLLRDGGPCDRAADGWITF